MNLFWQNGFLAPFLLLAAVPLLLHLFARTRPKIYLFSSNMFLRNSVKKNIRIRRPFDILLLIIRTLLFLAIILMFMKPLLFLFPDAAGLFQGKSVVVVIDASASMGLVEDGHTRFAAACAEASEILSGLSSRDKADIVWLKAIPEAEFPIPGSNARFLQQQLRKKKVTSEAGNSEEAIKQAVALFKNLEGRKELVIISDFQTSQWKDRDLPIPDEIKTVTIKIGKKRAGNLALTRITVSPRHLLKDYKGEIFCEVKNFSSEPRSCSVFFHTDGGRDNRTIMIPAEGSATVGFKHIFRTSGTIPVSFSISEDAFPEDNTIHSVINVSAALKVAVVEYNPYPADFWKRAIAALPWTKLEVLKPDALKNITDCDALFLSGWRGNDAEIIAKYLKAGGMVVCNPAPGCLHPSFTSLSGDNAPVYSATGFHLDKKNSLALNVSSPDDRIMKIFKNGEYGDPVSGLFKAKISTPLPKFLKKGETILKWNDDTPALTRFDFNGVLYYWGIIIDPKYSNWAYKVQFLPFMAELIRKGGMIKRNEEPDKNPGARLVLPLSGGKTADGIILNSGEGRKSVKTTVKYIDKKAYLISNPVESCGLYSWIYNGKIVKYDVVNFPEMESNLSQLEQNNINTIGAEVVGGRQLNQLNSGIELWPFLLLTALALAVAEGILMYWSARTQ